MNTQSLFAVAWLCFACVPAHAETISGTGEFSIALLDNPDYFGTGSFELERGRLVDFELTVLGTTWTEDDMRERCHCELVRDSGLGTIDPHIGLFGDFGYLIWDFHQDAFSMAYADGNVGFGGVTRGGVGNVDGPLSLDFRIVDVPEPGTLTLFALGLLGFVVVRQVGRQARLELRQ